MPLYAYRCTQCGHKFEKIQNFSAEPEQQCPKCHGVLERPLTAPRLNFKGAGWYVNDYAPKSGGSSSESSNSETKPEGSKSETKPETKTETKTSSEANSSATTPAPAKAATSGTSSS